MSADGRILLVDDDQNFRRVVQFNLEEKGYGVEVATNSAEALEMVRTKPPEIMITDIKMPGGSGLDLLDAVRKFARFPVIVVTAFGSIETAVDAMKRGATDFITKPFDREELYAAVARCFQLAQRLVAPEDSVEARKTAPRGSASRARLIGNSAAMQSVKQMVERLARSDVTILLTGESGSGKEVVARAIHDKSARSKTGRFIAVNSSAIPRELLESELFGHVKGSFTGAVADREGKFEQADGGTLFLDEIGDMPPELQAKILRALQEREIERVGGDGRPRRVDVRIVAATHRDLEKMVEEGKFREDLYYRLAVVRLRLPPLREHPEDLKPLVDHFLKKYAGAETPTIAPGVFDRLRRHSWPGNIRELENVLQRALALRAKPETIGEEDLPERFGTGKPPSMEDLFEIPAGGIILDEVEAKLIRSAMSQTSGNQTRAAELLGISRQTLIYRLQKYGIGKEKNNDSGNGSQP